MEPKAYEPCPTIPLGGIGMLHKLEGAMLELLENDGIELTTPVLVVTVCCAFKLEIVNIKNAAAKTILFDVMLVLSGH